MKIFTRRHALKMALLLAFAPLFSSSVRADEIAIKDGQKLAFLGDSITQFGANTPTGYVNLVILGFKANGLNVTPIPAGASGNTSKDMLARLDKSVLSKKPDWMTLSCGVNDVWHGEKGVNLEDYKANISAIVGQAQESGVKVMILTATPIREELDNDLNGKLAPYNEFLRDLAKQKGCLLTDLNADFQAQIKAAPKPQSKAGRFLTVDGVHMNPRGDELMASGILRAFGMNAAQLEKARQEWAKIPGGWAIRLPFYGSNKAKSLYLVLPLTRADYEKLEVLASQNPRPKSVLDIVRPLWEADVKAYFKPEGEYENLDAVFAAGKDKEVLAQIQEKLAAQVAELLKNAPA